MKKQTFKTLMLGIMTAAMTASLLTGCTKKEAEQTADTETTLEAVSQSAEQEESQSIATAATQALPEELGDPVTAEQLKDGEYQIEVESNASMFRVVDCKLTVADGKMSAVITMSGKGYIKMYMGTAAEADKASEADFIPCVETAEGAHTFQLPVEALNQKVTCCSYSKKRARWYDRTIVFRSDDLPLDAYQEIKQTTVESLNLADGEYQIDVSVEGGTGKVSVESPAALTVKDGKATAVISWSSPYYDYMLVNGEKYLPIETTDQASVYEIPIEGFDWKLPVTADTIAMSVPHEIDYTLYFDSTSLKAK